jgi:hypothetical protein
MKAPATMHRPNIASGSGGFDNVKSEHPGESVRKICSSQDS